MRKALTIKHAQVHSLTLTFKGGSPSLRLAIDIGGTGIPEILGLSKGWSQRNYELQLLPLQEEFPIETHRDGHHD